MSSLLLSKTDIGLKKKFAHNVRYGNSVTFRIWVALENLQYLDNHEPQRFDFCIESTPTDRTCQLYHHQVKIMIIYEGTNNLVSGAFLKCFSIYSKFSFREQYHGMYVRLLYSTAPLTLRRRTKFPTDAIHNKILKSLTKVFIA